MEWVSEALQFPVIIIWGRTFSVELSFFRSSISSLVAVPLRELSLRIL